MITVFMGIGGSSCIPDIVAGHLTPDQIVAYAERYRYVDGAVVRAVPTVDGRHGVYQLFFGDDRSPTMAAVLATVQMP